MKGWLHLVLATVLVAGEALAQPLAIPSPPAVGIRPHPGAQLPLGLTLVNEAGRTVRLGDYFDAGRPVLLVPGYYTCPQLCGLLMHGLLEALHDSGVSRRDVRVVRVSIDSQDTPAAARTRRDLDLAYADFLLGARAPDAPLDLHLLVGPAANTSSLAAALGFSYQRTPATAGETELTAASRYAHPAAVIVATPDGRVSRYLTGIQFDPAELRLAVAEASNGRVGRLSERIALLCAHFDPRWGRYSGTVMNGLRATCLLVAAMLAVWCWRRRTPGGSR